MGVRNYLIEGGSGTGKTAVAEELERRGYDVVHGDRELAYYGDPETGEPLQGPPPEGVTDILAWRYERWIWPVDKVRSLIADRGHAMTFFCGGSRNSHHFIDAFDAVFILEIDIDTLNRRLVARGDDEFGGKPAEQALIARLHATKAGLPKNGIIIDASPPVASVVDSILSQCGQRN
jgi:thymidylate kinase